MDSPNQGEAASGPGRGHRPVRTHRAERGLLEAHRALEGLAGFTRNGGGGTGGPKCGSGARSATHRGPS